MQQRRETKLVDFVVHIPTGLAYAWIFLGFVTAGMLVYTFFMAAAFKIKLFRGLQQWSAISKLALVSGPPLIARTILFYNTNQVLPVSSTGSLLLDTHSRMARHGLKS